MATKVNFSRTRESRVLSLQARQISNNLFGKSQVNLKQNITSLNRLVIGNRQVCLECRGIKTFSGGKLLKLQDKNATYVHVGNCSQRGRF